MAAKSPIWIGIDIGTQSVRAVAVADNGHLLASSAAPLTSNRFNQRHEQSPQEWISAAVQTLRNLTNQLSDPDDIFGLSVSATSGTIVIVDGDGHPVSAGIMYDDTRGRPYVDDVNRIGRDLWQRLGYRMQASWALPTMLWLIEHSPMPDGSRFASQADVITAALAGHRVASDSSHTLKAGLDLDTLQWPGSIFGALGIDVGLMPKVVEAGSLIGTVGVAAAAETGLPVGARLVAGMTDGCAAQIAAGALAPGQWNSVLGTTLVIKGASDERKSDPTGAIYSHRAPFGAGWFPGGASSTGAGSLNEWLPGRNLETLTQAAAHLNRRTATYPLLGDGERFPFVAPDAEAFFSLKSARPDTDVDLFADITLGVAWVERLAYDLLDLSGYNLEGTITLTGGGARNHWWNQLRCDVLRRPVRVPKEAEGAIGMAVLAAAGCAAEGGTDRLNRAANRMLPRGTELHPSERSWQQLAPVYVQVVDELSRRGWIDDSLRSHARRRAAI